MRSQLRSRMGNAGDYLDDASDYLKDRAERFGSEARSAINEGKRQASSVAGSATDFASSLGKSTKSLV